MTDNQDSSDEIHTISRRLQTVTTIDNIVNPRSGGARQTNLQNTPGGNTVTNILEPTRMQSFKEVKRRDKIDGVETPVRSLPELNVPEKIVLIIDVTKEKNCTKFKLGTGATYMPMFMIKRVVEIFVGAKSMIKRSHEFAVVTLSQDSMKWICDFTSNVKTVLNCLDALNEEPIDEDLENSFDLGQIFEILHAHVDPVENIDSNDPPAFITRAILIYCRSNCIPRFHSGRKYFEILSENPYFVLDSLFVHEPPSGDNKCEEVYNELTALDAKNFSYILEVGRNATKLHDNMAKLLAHPLQRPLQRNASYSISIHGNGTEEIQTNV